MNTPVTTCWHCGEGLPANAPLALVANVEHPVCCQGCRAAAEWISQLGLADYYRLRSAVPPRAPDPTQVQRSADAWQQPELSRHAVRTLASGQCETLLLIEGIRCTACVWLIERALAAVAGVLSVQVNAVAQRARIVWDPQRITLAMILRALARTGYSALPLDTAALDDSRRRESHAALKRLAVAGFGTMQAMMYASALYLGAAESMDEATRELMRWFGLLVTTPVVFYSARPFFQGAWRALRARTLGMDVPVAVAVALIYAASVVQALHGGGEVYFDSVSMFVFFLLAGRYLEMRARHRAGNLADAMARLVPAFADRYASGGALERVGVPELVPGDRVHVAQGMRMPADGVLESADCRVDEALLSGESSPLRKRCGDALIGGSMLIEGPAILRVQRVGTDTALAGIAALVARAQSERPRLARAGERAAAGFVLRTLALAALCAIGWSVFDPARAFAATLAVLVVSCPCAFALAVPAAVTRALAVLARQGVFVVHSDAIENLALASHAVLDKTGTLTDAHLELEAVDAADHELALVLAAALARGSHHPVAQALVRAASSLPVETASDVRTVEGGGLAGMVAGRSYRLGSPAFALDATQDDRDAVILAGEHGIIAAFNLSERLRPGAREAVSALLASGVAVEIVSGDAAAKVERVAMRLGITQWRARQSPAAKLERLRELRAAGARVLAVGDGINDAPVLAGADVAVALTSGAELAQAAGDVILDGTHLAALSDARAIARETLAVLRQNQRWALGYNLAVVPIAALGFVPPWLAAIGMSLSSLVVVLNALSIGRHTPVTPTPAATNLGHIA
ncbi:MAG: heavy metal translocating P-type ATPase [Candidimonas sp.]|nr:MAG: heavy metal translocating P-type ATPase [Candidimonas sp.]TAM19944.1 MAG: heavy metal translocating P-type ATPase [Candidimonas sp.]TAM76442.1 MAG: heavy metal translocating P-type ATPase [Candidimonas sp.]